MIAYCIDSEPEGFTRNANAWQKLAMFRESPDGIVVDFGKGERIGADVRLCCYEVLSTFKLLRACLRRMFRPCGKYALLLWDPPGIFRQDGNGMRNVVQRKTMDWMLEFAGRGAEVIVWNLHPGFAQSRYSPRVMTKSRFFPNGALVDYNQRIVSDVRHVPKRIAVSSAFKPNKGCWEIAELFIRLWKRDPEVSLVWVGVRGIHDQVMAKFREAGIPPGNVISPGCVPFEESLRLLASADVAFNFYRDLPSLRWNYVLKAPEFLSLGLPMVSPDLPGAHEYVKEGETGLFFVPEDLEDAYRQIVKLLYDGRLIDGMRRKCLALSGRFDWQGINASIMETLRRCV